jgi:hypothetical protein
MMHVVCCTYTLEGKDIDERERCREGHGVFSSPDLLAIVELEQWVRIDR